MNKYGKYLNLNVVQLNNSLQELMNTSIDEYRETVDFLKRSERYSLDYLYRLALDILDVLYYLIIGKIHSCAEDLDVFLDRLMESGEIDSLSLSLNILANAFSALNRIDKAIFCYMQTIQVETKKNNKINLRSAISYYNIGQLYRIYGDTEKALNYALKAKNLISELPINDYKHDSFWHFNTCEMSVMYFQLNDDEQGWHYYNLAKEKSPKKISPLAQATFDRLEMRIKYKSKDLEGMKASYNKLSQVLIKANDYPTLIAYTTDYYNYCIELGDNPWDVIQMVDKVLNISSGKGDYKNQISILEIIINHYISNNKPELAKPYIKLFSEQIKNYYLEGVEQNQKMIDMMKEKLFYVKSLEEAQNEQRVLKEEYNKILNKNVYIEKLNKRLEIVRDLGMDITDSDKIEDMFMKTYENIKDIVKIDKIVLLGLNKEKQELNTECFWSAAQDEGMDEISLKDKKSVLGQFLRDKETLVLNNFSEKRDLIRELKIDGDMYKSAIISPLLFKSNLISLVYILSKEEDTYKDLSTEGIIQISVFMAVAINNIKRKEHLTKIIEENKKTKKELEKINEELSILSKKDGLTKINNRLAYYEYYRENLKKAVNNKKIISEYMIDIDHFKDYNDYFGHLKGDEVLIKVAKVLIENFEGDYEFLARFGGEEFIGFSIDEDMYSALEKGKQIRKAVEDLKIEHPKSKTGYLTISVGVATIKEPEINRSYVSIADKALYRAKNGGRNNTVQIIRV